MWLLLYARPPPTRLLLYLDNNWFNDYRCFLHTADVKLGAVPVNHFFCYFYLTDIAAKWLVLFAYLWKEICVWPTFDPFLVPLLLPYLLLWVCFWKVRNSTGFNIFMARTFEIWAWVTMFENHQRYLVKLLGQKNIDFASINILFSWRARKDPFCKEFGTKIWILQLLSIHFCDFCELYDFARLCVLWSRGQCLVYFCQFSGAMWVIFRFKIGNKSDNSMGDLTSIYISDRLLWWPSKWWFQTNYHLSVVALLVEN